MEGCKVSTLRQGKWEGRSKERLRSKGEKHKGTGMDVKRRKGGEKNRRMRKFDTN